MSLGAVRLVPDEDPLQDPHLRGGQPVALLVVEGLVQVANQVPELCVEVDNLVGLCPQHGVPEDPYGPSGHKRSILSQPGLG
jgi:hypothetical protein